MPKKCGGFTMISKMFGHSSRIGLGSRLEEVIRPVLANLLCVGIVFVQLALAQVPKNHAVTYSTIPYGGKTEDALAAAAAGKTIPLATYTFRDTKDGLVYTNIVVGSSPFAADKGTTTINFLIVPVIVEIGSTTFDPTAVDTCIGPGVTPLAAFQQSPVLQEVIFDGGTGNGHAAKINGVDVGKGTYLDAFRRAQFWKEVAGTKYHTVFHVTTLPPWTISASEVQNLGGGNVLTTSCAPMGVLSSDSFQDYIQNTVLPGIPSITPTTFALFLMKDVVTTESSDLNCFNGCEIGYHGSFGTPAQTYAVSEYDSTLDFWLQPGITNISYPAREVADWMDDPLNINATPPWGNIGTESGCLTGWGSGQPLTGTDFPLITMPNGVTYNPQELAFWSWFYNAENTRSIGAGGKFSSNGTFTGPSQDCPPGGTY
jgi:hypothetical protein